MITLTPEAKQWVREAMANDQQPVSITTLWAALMDVIDAGCRHTDGFTHEWKLNSPTEDFANAQRCDFADAVARRVGELQAEPHWYDVKLLAKLRDAQAQYQRGYSDGWSDAMDDRTEEANPGTGGKAMKMNDNRSELICAGCGKRPSDIDEYVSAASERHSGVVDMTPDDYVWQEEGTLNRETGQFLCTDCYIKAGMPSSPRGWTV